MCTDSSRPRASIWRERQGGLTLIELVIFILIISIGMAGIVAIMNITSVSATDPMRTKQALAIAESLLEEIELQAFTYCDPDDATATTATSATVGAGACTATVQTLGPTAGETRYIEPRFDNVADYHGFNMVGIVDLQNTAIAGLAGYNATVIETQAGDEIRIDVSVTGASDVVTLTGYRYRYAPRTLP